MERYTRVHTQNSKTITLEIVEISHDWKIKVNSQEKGGRGSTTVGLHADSLEKAKQLADDPASQGSRLWWSVRRVGESVTPEARSKGPYTYNR